MNKKTDWLMVAGWVALLGAAAFAVYTFYPRGDDNTVVERHDKVVPIPNPSAASDYLNAVQGALAADAAHAAVEPPKYRTLVI